MDPIMKLLEEDEDETMHSGADVDALTAALNRHIEGNSSSTSQPADSHPVMSQGNHSQLFHQWQNSSQDENANMQSQFDQSSLPQVESVSGEQKQPLPGADCQHHNIDASRSQEVGQSPLQPKQEDVVGPSIQQPSKPSQLRIPDNNSQHVQESGRTTNSEREAQLSKLQHMNQQGTTSEQGSNAVNKGKQEPFALLLPVITPQLDKERAMQLNSLYARLKKNEIPKDGFVRQIRGIVGDQMLKMAVMKLQAQEGIRNSQGAANQYQSQGTTQQKNLSVPLSSAPQYSHSFAQAHQQGQSSSVDPSQKVSSAGHVQAISQKVQDDHRPDSHAMQPNQVVSSSLNPSIQERERFARLQGLTKQQQQHLHFSSTSIPMYGTSAGNINHYSGVSSTAAKPQHQDPLMSQASLNQNSIPTQTTNAMGTVKFDRAHPVADGNRIHVASSAHMTALQHHSAPWNSATTSDHVSSTTVKQEPIDQGNEQQQKPQAIITHVMSSGESKPGTMPGASKDNALLDKEAAKINFQVSTFPPNSAVTATLSAHQESQMSNPRIPSAMQSSGNNGRSVVPKKPIIGMKKPLETSSPPLPSTKQKVSGGFLDQSIEQLNDVTAISGVNLRVERGKRKRNTASIQPRNKYAENPPDFGHLASLYPSFLPYVSYSADGRARIDWTDFNATRELTRVLLLHDHAINWWIPDGQLCPTVPNRSNYIHWIEHLLSSDIIPNTNMATKNVRGFDIGTGANCIYPLLGSSLLGWTFVGSDVTDVAIQWAQTNVKNNPHLSDLIEIRKAAKWETQSCGVSDDDRLMDKNECDDADTLPSCSNTKDVQLNNSQKYLGPPLLVGVVKEGEIFDFCMCNPPFFDDMEKAGLNPKTACGGTSAEMVCPGGEKAFILRIIEDSVVLKQSFRWYTSMVGRKINLKFLISKLREVGVTVVKTTEFVQGQTCRWGLAWSFVPSAKKIVPSFVSEKSVLSFVLEGIQRQFSAMHVLQFAESFFSISGASCKLDASLFTVDVTASDLHCNAISNDNDTVLTKTDDKHILETSNSSDSKATASSSLSFCVSVFQQNPGTLLVRGTIRQRDNFTPGLFPLVFQRLEVVMRRKFCKTKRI